MSQVSQAVEGEGEGEAQNHGLLSIVMNTKLNIIYIYILYRYITLVRKFIKFF